MTCGGLFEARSLTAPQRQGTKIPYQSPPLAPL
jgi:hypothetical protein